MTKKKKDPWKPPIIPARQLEKQNESLQRGYDTHMDAARAENRVLVMHPWTGVIMSEAEFKATFRGEVEKDAKARKDARVAELANRAIEATQVETHMQTPVETVSAPSALSAAVARPAVQQVIEAA